jgi:RNA polymerase sigma-70 factor (ECF subfamily)
VSDVEDGRHVESAKPQAAGEDVIEGLLERLSARDRLVLTLLYVEGQSVVEAAELSGWSQTMVKVQAYRARQRLKKLVSK